MQVKLISVTKPCVEGINTAEELVAYCARVSNPSNQLNTSTSSKLLRYCADHHHWSIFEMVNMCCEIKTSRAIAAQILRHRSFSFQEFCISGDSLITVILPKNKKPYYIPIKKLFDRQNWKSYKNILVRTFDEKTKTFKFSKIKEVFNTGKKSVYELTLHDGKKIKCTKEHKFYTENGFDTLENIVGLNSKYHSMSKIAYIGVNGIPVYQSYDWLKTAKLESIQNKIGLKYIAEKAGCSYYTIRKWLKINNLSFSKKEVSSYTEPWNKNKFGYKTSLIVSEKHKDAIRKARSGSKSNWWKGGCDRSDRLKICDWCNSIRSKKLKDYNYSCSLCLSNNKLELDHIIPVWKNKELSYDYNNIQVLCSSCHDKKHSLEGDAKVFRQLHNGNKLTVKFTKVKKINFIGYEETFDLEVDDINHNYVANKILVHNSQRYSSVTELEPIELRRQGKTNRQVGDGDFDLAPEDRAWMYQLQHESQLLYNKLIDSGVARESARFILPLNTQTTLYMSGTIRSWITYLQLRSNEDTQKEHRDIAEALKVIFKNEFPAIYDALF